MAGDISRSLRQCSEKISQGAEKIIKSIPSIVGSFSGIKTKEVEADRVLNRESLPENSEHSAGKSIYDRDVVPENNTKTHHVSNNSDDYAKNSSSNYPTAEKLIKGVAVELGVDPGSENFWGELSECSTKDFYMEVLEAYRDDLFGSVPENIVARVIDKFPVNRELVTSLEELYSFDDNGSRIAMADIYHEVLSEMRAAGITMEGSGDTMGFLEDIVNLEKMRMESGFDDITVRNQSFSLSKAFKKLGEYSGVTLNFSGRRPAGDQSSTPKTAPKQPFRPGKKHEFTFNSEHDEKKEYVKKDSPPKPNFYKANTSYREMPKKTDSFDAKILEWGMQTFSATQYEKSHSSEQIVFFNDLRH